MKIAFANYLMMPFAVGALASLYYAWTHFGDGSIWIAPFVVVLALIFILKPQINWWWYSKHPPALEPEVAAMLNLHPFYARLDTSQRQRFRDRMALSRMAYDWTANGMPDDAIPPDIQSAIAAQSVCVTWALEEFWFKKFEKIVIAPQPFFTPNFPFPHASEHYPPDGCVMLSADRVMAAFVQPQQYFNIALYEFVRVLRHTYPERFEGIPTEFDWETLEKTAPPAIDQAAILQVLSLPEADTFGVAAHHYLMFREQMERAQPEWVRVFDRVFSDRSLRPD